MSAAAEIATARAAAADIERKLSAGLVAAKRRRASHTIMRACRFYAAALQFELDRDAASAAIKTASGGGCSHRPVNADQAIQEVRPFHGHTMERNDAKRHIAER